jgi:hypothetical protein
MKHLLLAASLLAVAACSQQNEASMAPSASSEPTGEPAAKAAWAEPSSPAAVSSEPTKAEPASIDHDVLSPTGIGSIVVGQALPASIETDGAQESESCRIYPDKALRIYAMTDGKVVARVTAMKGSKVQTAKGIAVGATEAAVRSAYPDAAASPHKYVEAPGKYLDWRPGGGNAGLRFEIDGQGKVSAIHAGREPEIEYVEGCS